MLALEPTDVYERVRAILAHTLRIDADRVRPQAHLARDLGMDSLRTIETNVAIEATFGIVTAEAVRPDELGIETVSDLVAYVAGALEKAS